jgi:putative transposase
MVIDLKRRSYTHLVITTHQYGALKTSIRSHSDFWKGLRSSATFASPRLCKTDFSGHLPRGRQKETKRLMQECCERQGLTLIALETDEDHIHVFVSAPPRFSPALIANLLKGYSSRSLREQFPQLKKLCGKEHLWTSSYYVGTAGNVSAEIIKRYIMECQGK